MVKHLREFPKRPREPEKRRARKLFNKRLGKLRFVGNDECAMKKLDRRVVRTRKALVGALISLAKEKSYDQITIRDLTDRADVGYATFYRHYKSKDELLSHFMRNVLQDVWDQLDPEMSYYEEALTMFKAIEPHRDGILLGLSFPREHPALKPVWDDAVHKVRALYAAKDEFAIPFDVSVNHIINSVIELIRWWFVEGQDYSPEQMATIQSELIFKVTESVALDNLVRNASAYAANRLDS